MNVGCSAKWVVVASAMLLLAADVSAQQGLHQSMRERGPGGLGSDSPRPQRMLVDERQSQAAPDGDASQRQRMTPEERRQLRRDVHDAGRDLYPERMRERRREMRRGE